MDGFGFKTDSRGGGTRRETSQEAAFCRGVTVEMTSPDRPALSDGSRDFETAGIDGVVKLRLITPFLVTTRSVHRLKGILWRPAQSACPTAWPTRPFSVIHGPREKPGGNILCSPIVPCSPVYFLVSE